MKYCQLSRTRNKGKKRSPKENLSLISSEDSDGNQGNAHIHDPNSLKLRPKNITRLCDMRFMRPISEKFNTAMIWMKYLMI